MDENRIGWLLYRKSDLEILYQRTKKPALDGDIPKRAIRRRFCDGIDPKTEILLSLLRDHFHRFSESVTRLTIF